MMPHPERVCEDIVGGIDGRGIFQSMIDHVLGGETVMDEPDGCPRCGALTRS